MIYPMKMMFSYSSEFEGGINFNSLDRKALKSLQKITFCILSLIRKEASYALKNELKSKLRN